MKNGSTLQQFEVGKTYATRSACDHDCIFTYEVTRRTAKFLWLKKRGGEIERRGVYIYGEQEHCKPEGTYSMCPVISAAEDELIEGGIKHEVESRARRVQERKEAIPRENPQLVGLGRQATMGQIADEAARLLAASGLTREEVAEWTPDRFARELIALKRRQSFHIVAA